MSFLDFSILDFVIIGLAAVAAGAVNALAGGGTLITFPILTAVLTAAGVPSAAVSANVTNTVALCPGYLGATVAQAKNLAGQRRRLWLLVPTAALGGIIGGILLLATGERLFRTLVPYLILIASGLLAFQDPIRAWVFRRTGRTGQTAAQEVWAIAPIMAASIYGGYFTAGMSVLILAVLGLVLEDTLTRLNALKQSISFTVSTAAALFYVFSGPVVWPAALVMAVGAIIGGSLGGLLAGRVQPIVLRRIIVTAGVVMAILYWVR
jgi:uncharacterized membrane protein YfcA